MNKLGRQIKWAIINAAFGAALYFGIVFGVTGAANVALFYAWLSFVLSWGALSDDLVRKFQAGRSPTVPVWLDVWVDVAAIIFMVWHGWLWTAIAYASHTILVARMHTPLPPPAEVVEKAAA